MDDVDICRSRRCAPAWAFRRVHLMATATSLTLRALLSQAAARAHLDRPAPVTAGLTPAAKALRGGRMRAFDTGLTLLVVPTDKDVEQLTADARFFYGALEGASEAAVERAVLPLPSLQIDPYRGMTPHFRVAAARARALHGAATGTARLIVASAAALLPRVSPPERLLQASIDDQSRERRSNRRLSPICSSTRVSRARIRSRSTARSPSAAASSTSFRPATPSRCASSSSATWSSRCGGSIRRRSGRPAPPTSFDVVPVRERFDDERRSAVARFPSAPRAAFACIVSEDEQVEEQAQKGARAARVELRDAAARGHVVALPPERGVRRAGTISRHARSRRAAARRARAIETRASVRCPASRRWSSAAASTTGSPRFARRASAATPFCSSPTVTAAPSGRSRSCRNTRSSPFPSSGAEDAHAAAVLVAVGSLVARIPSRGCGLQIYAETDVFEEERHALGEAAKRRARRSSPTCAT